MINKIKGISRLFLAIVVLPTVLAVVYFGFIASDIYISEARFVVRSPDKKSSSGLGSLLQSSGFGSSGDEIYAVNNFAVSRDALTALNKNDAVRLAYSREGISLIDRFDPIGVNGSFEALFKYYTRKISVQYDATSQITTLKVKAYSPQDAQRFSSQLLSLSEALVNRLNQRGRVDLVGYAETEATSAKAQSRRAAAALARYRDRKGIVDPEKQAVVQIQMVSKLQDEVIAANTQLAQLRRFAPRNPQIPVLEVKLASLKKQINEELAKVAGDRTGSLASAVEEYQGLLVESTFADKQLAASLASLQDARNEARRKQAYVERIVAPNLPDDAAEPRRLRSILATLLVSLVTWAIATMLLAGVKEHRD